MRTSTPWTWQRTGRTTGGALVADHKRRRAAVEQAIARLFSERSEYRSRRVGQITCTLVSYLLQDFARRDDGLPKDAEVGAIRDGLAAGCSCDDASRRGSEGCYESGEAAHP